MNTMAISDFKARALELIEDVAKTKERLVITKRGKPVAEVVPYNIPDAKSVPGKLSHTLVFEKDVVSPLGEELWDACR